MIIYLAGGISTGNEDCFEHKIPDWGGHRLLSYYYESYVLTVFEVKKSIMKRSRNETRKRKAVRCS